MAIRDQRTVTLSDRLAAQRSCFLQQRDLILLPSYLLIF